MDNQQNGEIKIESGIPVPQGIYKIRGQLPFGALEVGDSFLVPDGMVKQSSIRQASVDATRTLKPKRFTARKVEGGIRIWRVA